MKNISRNFYVALPDTTKIFCIIKLLPMKSSIVYFCEPEGCHWKYIHEYEKSSIEYSFIKKVFRKDPIEWEDIKRIRFSFGGYIKFGE